MNREMYRKISILVVFVFLLGFVAFGCLRKDPILALLGAVIGLIGLIVWKWKFPQVLKEQEAELT